MNRIMQDISKKQQQYYFKKSNFLLIQKYGLSMKKTSITLLREIEVSCISVGLLDEDKGLKEILFFLEQITGHKARYIGVYKYIGAVKNFFFRGDVTLRKTVMEDFLVYLRLCLGIYYKRNSFLISDVKKNFYNLKISDFNIFLNFTFSNFKGVLMIKFKGNNVFLDIQLDDYLQLIKIK